MIEEFIKLVNLATSTLPEEYDIKDLYKHYNVSQTHPNAYLSNEIHEGIYSLIHGSILSKTNVGAIRRHDLLKLKSYFVIRYYYSNTDYNPYYEIIDTLISITSADKNYFKPFNEEECWIKAISLVKDLLILNPKRPNEYTSEMEEDKDEEETDKEYMFRTSYNEEKQVAEAGIYFRDLGYDLRLDINGIMLANASKDKWIKNLRSKISKIGGEDIVFSIFSHLQSEYDHTLNRYLIYRKPGIMPSETSPANPYGYILNLAVQYIGDKGRDKDSNKNKKEVFLNIIDECKKIATLYQVQPYHIYDAIFYNPSNVIDTLVSSVLHDSIYTFQQLDFNYLPFLLREIFKWIDTEKFKMAYGFSVEDYITVTEAVFNSQGHYSIKINPKHFKISLSDEVIIKVLTSLSHEREKINNDFNFPEDFSLINFHNKPLVKTEDYFYLANKAWCAPAFLDCIAVLGSNLYTPKEYWARLGFEVENAIRNRLYAKGILFKSGKYENNKTIWECDFVIEDDKRIVFIETKNKTLTTEARSGNALTIINDLLCSIVSEMKQTGRHKVVLEKEGEIVLDNGEKISFKNRKIERVGIVFSDYGFIQSRLAVLELLRNLALSKLEFTNSVDPKVKNSLTKMLLDYQNNLKDIFQNEPDYRMDNFMDCYFFSLPMLLMMIDNSNSNEELIDELLLFKNISFSSMDFYVEYSHLKRQ